MAASARRVYPRFFRIERRVRAGIKEGDISRTRHYGAEGVSSVSRDEGHYVDSQLSKPLDTGP